MKSHTHMTWCTLPSTAINNGRRTNWHVNGIHQNALFHDTLTLTLALIMTLTQCTPKVWTDGTAFHALESAADANAISVDEYNHIARVHLKLQAVEKGPIAKDPEYESCQHSA